MIRAVVFDMFETLITHYRSPLYFGAQMAKDAGISHERFEKIWRETEGARTIGELSLEQVLERILRESGCYHDGILDRIAEKRIEAKRECFRHLHKEIIPMLTKIKEKGLFLGLISNCYSEEAKVIRESLLFPYFDAVFLSYEQGVKKPEEEIFRRCIKKLSLQAKECLYVGDGGSQELEAARKAGMKPVQAIWYLQGGERQIWGQKAGFCQCETPLAILNFIHEKD